MKLWHWVGVVCLSMGAVVMGQGAVSDFFDGAEVASSVAYPTLTAVQDKLRMEYINPNLVSKDLEYGAIAGLLKALKDPYTRFLPPDQFAQYKWGKAKSGSKGVSSVVFYGNIGYVALANFDSPTVVSEMLTALASVTDRHVHALVLDLRKNGGGNFDAMLQVAGLFLGEADVVSIVGRDGQKKVHRGAGVVAYSGPLVVLIDKGTASSAEILALALKEWRRVPIVGETSYGKTSVQKVVEFQDGSGLIMTVGHYVSTKGVQLGGKGIVVDTALVPDIGVRGDSVLAKAIDIAGIEGYKKK